MKFAFKEIKHVPGKQMYIADALSRLRVRDQMAQSTIDDDDIIAYVGSVISSLHASYTRPTANNGSARRGSSLQPDESVLLQGMA